MLKFSVAKFAVALLGMVWLNASTMAQDIATLTQRPALPEQYRVLAAPKAADGSELTGIASAFLAVNEKGRVTDVVWQDAGVAQLDKLARAQTLPTRSQPKQQCDAEKACQAVAAYQKISFIFPASKLSKPTGIRTAIRAHYHPLSAQNGEEGAVVLVMFIDASGIPRVVAVHKSSGFRRLDLAAIRAARKARFYPAEQQGRPVLSKAYQSIHFRLRISACCDKTTGRFAVIRYWFILKI